MASSADLVFKAHRLFNHSTLSLRVMKKSKEVTSMSRDRSRYPVVFASLYLLVNLIQGGGFGFCGLGVGASHSFHSNRLWTRQQNRLSTRRQRGVVASHSFQVMSLSSSAERRVVVLGCETAPQIRIPFQTAHLVSARFQTVLFQTAYLVYLVRNPSPGFTGVGPHSGLRRDASSSSLLLSAWS